VRILQFNILFALVAFISSSKILEFSLILILPLSIVIVISLNVKERLFNESKEKEKLYKFCIEKIQDLSKLMDLLYALNKKYRLSKVEHFSIRLSACDQIGDYEILLSLINHEIMYISAVIEVWSTASNQKSQNENDQQETKESKSSIRNKRITAALMILELSPKIKDFTVIKKQYHSLMMKYHPDRNHMEEATEKAISINAAYELLEIEFSVS